MKNPSIITVMMRVSSLCLALLAGPIVRTEAANSSPPTNMTFQAFLTGQDGTPLGNTLPQNYDIKFKIYVNAAPTTGESILWAEKQTVTVDKGYFSVLLGNGSSVSPDPHPFLHTLFQSSTASDRYIGMFVVGAGSGQTDLQILPRMQLLPGPYAYLATMSKQLEAAGTNRLSDFPLFLRSSPDTNNGLSYTATFANQTIDGPKLFGNSSGVLGTVSGNTEKTALRWDRTVSSESFVAINKPGPAATALDVNGTVTATAFSGNGANLTAINAGNVSGALSTANLPSTVARTDASQTFSAAQTFNAALNLGVAASISSPKFKVYAPIQISSAAFSGSPMRRTGTATTGGGTLLVFIHASAFTEQAEADEYIDLYLDNEATARAHTFQHLDEVSEHRPFPPGPFIITGVPAGSHTFKLQFRNTTLHMNANDEIGVTVIEFPF